jgi:hypothetical protein
LLVALLGACSASGDGSGSTEADSGPELVPVTCPGDDVEIMRPEGWGEATHCDVEPDYEAVFGGNIVRRIDIVMEPGVHESMMEDLATILSGGGPGSEAADVDPMWVPVELGFDGSTWWQVGMRYKGHSSLRSSWQSGVRKLGFRLNFEQYENRHPELENQRFYGFEKLTFAPGFRDPSYVRDALAVEIFRGLGIPAAQLAFYEIHVDLGDGSDPVCWGLYTTIEDPSDAMMQTVFADDSGNLYKPEEGCADWTCFDATNFEKKRSVEDIGDFSDVEAAIDALHADRSDADTWRSNLEAVFDVPSFLRWLAINTTMGNWDSYGQMPHNYYLYGDPTDGGRLTWLPWDHNEALQDGFHPTLSILLDEVGESWPLIRYLLDDPVYAEVYRDELVRTLDGSFSVDILSERASALQALIRPHVEAEEAPYSQLPSMEVFEESVSGPDGLIEYIQSRHDLVQQVLDGQ